MLRNNGLTSDHAEARAAMIQYDMLNI